MGFDRDETIETQRGSMNKNSLPRRKKYRLAMSMGFGFLQMIQIPCSVGPLYVIALPAAEVAKRHCSYFIKLKIGITHDVTNFQKFKNGIALLV